MDSARSSSQTDNTISNHGAIYGSMTENAFFSLPNWSYHMKEWISQKLKSMFNILYSLKNLIQLSSLIKFAVPSETTDIKSLHIMVIYIYIYIYFMHDNGYVSIGILLILCLEVCKKPLSFIVILYGGKSKKLVMQLAFVSWALVASFFLKNLLDPPESSTILATCFCFWHLSSIWKFSPCHRHILSCICYEKNSVQSK